MGHEDHTIRDWHGEVLACQNSSNSFRVDPILAECEVLWRAIQLCEELGLEKVKLEGDAKVVIYAILKNEECSILYGSIINDVKSYLTSGPPCSLDFVHRERNNVAHLLARFGLSLVEESLDWRLSICNRVCCSSRSIFFMKVIY